MDAVIGKRILSVAVVSVLGLSFSQVSIAANDIDINSSPTNTEITDDGLGGFTSNDDTANLNIGDINSALNNGYAVSITTTESGANSQAGDINLGASLNFSGNTSSQVLTLSAHNDININSTIVGSTNYLGTTFLLNPDSDALNGGVVNLNSSMSGNLDTTVSGDLLISGTGLYSLNDYRASLVAESIDVAAGGSFSYAAGLLNLTNSGLTIGTGGLLGDAKTLVSGQNLILSNNNVLTVDTGAILALSGGRLEVGSITNNGTFSFNSGELALTNSGLTVGAGGLLGSNVFLSHSDNVYLLNDNVLTIDNGSSLTMSAYTSSLTAGSINNNGTFDFQAGSLNLTNSGLTIGGTGLIGSNVVLTGIRSLSISGDVTVDDNATLSVNDAYGRSHFQSNLNNSGTVTFATSGELTVDGIITNDGATASLIVDDGATLSAGSITNLDGGSFAFNSGQLNLTNSGLTVGDTGLLGNNVIISPTRNLSVSGEISIDTSSTLSLFSGTLAAGSIDNTNGGTFNYSSGHLMLTNSGLTVGTTGLLGDTVELSGTRYMTVAGDVSVDAAASLVVGNSVSGSQTRFLGNLNNAGTVSVDDSLASPAGRLVVDGVITNDGTTGASLNLNGGSLSAGSISNINGGSFNFTSGNLFLTNSGLTVGNSGLFGNDYSLTSGQYLSVAGDVVVESGASLTVAASASFQGSLNNSGLVSLASGGSLGLGVGAVTNDGAGASLSLDGGHLTAGSISNVNGGSFSFNSGTLNLTDSSLTVGNTGLVGNSLVLDNKSLYLTGSTLADRTLTIDTGASVTLNGGTLIAGDVNNSGSFNFVSGNLNLLDTNFTVGSGSLLGDAVTLGAGMGVRVLGGNGLVVDAGGSFTLDGGSLSVSSITNNGSFIYNSGDLVSSGNLSIGGNSAYSIDPGSRFYLGSGGVLTVEVGTALALNGGSLTAGTINGGFDFNSGSLRLSDSNLVIGMGGLLGNNVTLGAGKYLNMGHYDVNSADNYINIDSGATLTLDGGGLTTGTISNSGTFNFNAGSLSITNGGITVGANGMLGSSVILDASKNLSINGALAIEAGSAVVLDGGSLSMSSASNNGSFAFNSGSLSTGIMTVGTGGLLSNTVNLDSTRALSVGSLTVNSGATMSINGGSLSLGSVVNNGSFNFNSGSLSVGSLTVGAGGLLGSNVALSTTRDLNVYGTVNVNLSASVTVNSGYTSFDHLRNNGTVSVAGGTMSINGSYGGTVENTGTVIVANTAAMNVSGPSYIQNAGTTNIQTGGTLNIYDADGSTYTQNAGTTTVNGVLNASTVVINGGVLNGAGTINGNLEIWKGTLNPGNSPGIMEVTGDFVLTEAGTLHLEVAGDGMGGFTWDQLIVGGGYDLQGGEVQISLSSDLDINIFNTDFTMDSFFRSGTSDSNTGLDLLELALFESLDLYVFDDGAIPQWYSLALTETGEFASTASAPPPSSVPVPAAVWLFGSGLIGLFGLARRKAA